MSAFWKITIIWLFSDKCRSLVRREWEWEGTGIKVGNGMGMGIKSWTSWEWDWEWEWTDGNGREWECCKPFPHISNSTVWPQYTNIPDRQTDKQRSDSIRANRFTNGRPKTSTVWQNPYLILLKGKNRSIGLNFAIHARVRYAPSQLRLR